MEEVYAWGSAIQAAVMHPSRMPDPEQRRQHAVALAEELLSVRTPHASDVTISDSLLANITGAIH